MIRLVIPVIVAMAVPGIAASQAPVPPENVIVAQGEAVMKQAPDVAWVTVAVEARGGRPEEARERAATATTSVLAALKTHVPATAIKTSGFSVVPEMDYRSGPQVKGYVARNQLEVQVDNLDKLPQVMDASVSSGATTVSGLRFDVKTRPQVEREALRLAVQDGMARAEAIAKGAGRTLGPIMRMQEQRMTGQGIRFSGLSQTAGAGGGRGGAAESTPVTPGEIEIRAIVVLTVGIR